ncbi:hypothetical protein Hypma_004023 [Hypsizygus marmoreus]|uniref:54S ribosomal protein L37, mitochondrial n=1 Tax=Hypsizygus marmoreus TaxID=39966 RepID=A0A369J2M3_HYPMA|nr:hypothetical protein Hypma_004023 [Hypsizygus marmoreus]
MSLLRVFQRPLVCLRTRAYTTNVAPVADAADKPKKAPAAQTQAPRSSCAPDTIITGANYLKAQPPVLALADDQYPEWLCNLISILLWHIQS